MVRGVPLRTGLARKPVQQQVYGILGDTHSECWFPPSSSSSSASEGMQVPRGVGKLGGGLFASCLFIGVDGTGVGVGCVLRLLSLQGENSGRLDSWVLNEGAKLIAKLNPAPLPRSS